jgi:CheY-like chemotaxis protein
MPSPAAAAPKSASLGSASGRSRRLQLLVADDNETNRRVMSAVLESIAAQVTFAVDGVDAVQAAARSQFDVILMDIEMPHMGGLEATRRIRQQEASRSARRTPILAVTASAGRHERHEYQAAGLDGIIPKPIDARRLLAAIHDLAGVPSPMG